MSELSTIRDKLWSGSINIKLKLNPKDSKNQADIHYYYLSINRNQYLYSRLIEIVLYFKSNLLIPEWCKNLQQFWFETTDENIPVKWNYPIGLSYDLLNLHNKRQQHWELTMNCRNYPKEYIIPIYHDSFNLDFLENYWINQLKQACYVINGSSKLVMNLSKDDVIRLWQSVLDHDYTAFNLITSKFINETQFGFRRIPIRIYLPSNVSDKVLQPLIKPTNEEGESSITIGAMLANILPELFSSGYKFAYPLSHGVLIPQDATILDIFKLFMYIDGFLHIKIVIRE
ncbi:hypothetical protein PACTADRAFT_50568 [Pachysolen tannophilus NRRL Y-2460]|uniref:Autophagy protein 5 n=1 Tax=Pachysolen tannophilus NRRL Y-2460 TaxID=669874 RepID=A0A1E4TSI9_PACTA|nr:hypothetical protein PACTADRAFT_50568 [Pachysolen tannophilus NRRL Y-2460]